MTDNTKTILITALVVAGIYVFTEFYIKPKVGSNFGVRVK